MNADPTRFPLFHHSFQPTQLLVPGSSPSILRASLTGDWEDGPAGVFLTPVGYKRPEDRQRFLALTYQPRYLSSWGLVVTDPLWESDSFNLCNSYHKKDSFNRVWPSFGQDGGGLEIILTTGRLVADPLPVGAGSPSSYRGREHATALSGIRVGQVLAAMRDGLIQNGGADFLAPIENPTSFSSGKEKPTTFRGRLTAEGEPSLTYKTRIGSDGCLWNVTVSLAVESLLRNRFEPVIWVDLWRDTMVCGSVEGVQSVREIYSVGPERVKRGGKLVKIQSGTLNAIESAVGDAMSKLSIRFQQDPKAFPLPEPFLTQDFKLLIPKEPGS